MAIQIPYTGATEGAVDEAVLRSVISSVDRELHQVYVTGGRSNLERRLPGFNEAARHGPWVVLIDLDRTTCAPDLIESLVGSTASQMHLRVVVRAVEAWLLADSEAIASLLSVSTARIPSDPDALVNPKESLVDTARHSRRRAIREDMVPRPGSGRPVGRAYEARLIELVTRDHHPWRPHVAAQTSESLRRCLDAVA